MNKRPKEAAYLLELRPRTITVTAHGAKIGLSRGRPRVSNLSENCVQSAVNSRAADMHALSELDNHDADLLHSFTKMILSVL